MKRTRDSETSNLSEFLSRHTDYFRRGVRHILAIDPSLVDVIMANDFPAYLIVTQNEDTLQDYFANLACGIIAQQISGMAAKAIKKRIIDMFNGKFPSYGTLKEKFYNNEKENIRSCGLSARKLQYLESLTLYFYDKGDSLMDLFDKGTDDEIITELVANVKGIGPWSAKMFLASKLKREDVFAPDDLGIARGCSKYLESRPEILRDLLAKRSKTKKSKIKHKNSNWRIFDENIVDECGKMFSPYRTLFMYILWRLASANVDAMISAETDFSGR